MLAKSFKALAYAALLCIVPFCAHAMCWQAESDDAPVDQDWDQVITHAGNTTAGELIRIYQNKETGTWSITVTTPAGVECLISTGQGWRSLTRIAGERI